MVKSFGTDLFLISCALFTCALSMLGQLHHVGWRSSVSIFRVLAHAHASARARETSTIKRKRTRYLELNIRMKLGREHVESVFRVLRPRVKGRMVKREFQVTILQKSHANLTYFFDVARFELFLGLDCVFVS